MPRKRQIKFSKNNILTQVSKILKLYFIQICFCSFLAYNLSFLKISLNDLQLCVILRMRASSESSSCPIPHFVQAQPVKDLPLDYVNIMVLIILIGGNRAREI